MMTIMRVLNSLQAVFVGVFKDCKCHDKRKVTWSKRKAVIIVGLAPPTIVTWQGEVLI